VGLVAPIWLSILLMQIYQTYLNLFGT
jgi:hypothetical protein